MKLYLNSYNIFFIVAFVFALLSSLRLPFLPELQLLVILLGIALLGNINKNIFYLLIIVLCTHHYVVPDAVLRFSSEDYPSIYTRSYFGIKLLDVLTIVFFLYSLKKSPRFRLFLNKNLPIVILLIPFIAFLALDFSQIARDMMLFIIRSYLLILAVFLFASSLENKELIFISKIVIFAWTMKMFFAIIFPHESPLYRTLLGFDGIIYFAGDEYLTLGVFFSIILMLSSKNELNYIKYFLVLNFIFLLTLIAQRKGGVPYFIILNAVFFIYFFVNLRIINICFNLILVMNTFATIVFLWLVVPLLSEIVQLGFEEYSALSVSAIDSLLNLTLFQQLFGITPFGKYELINLASIFDHSMSFGKEVGEVYRYQLWTIPMGRLILNVGLIGFIFVYTYLVYKAFRENVLGFYLILSFLPFFYFSLITPVSALGIAFALTAYLRKKNESRLR